jgi:hypothetical protein
VGETHGFCHLAVGRENFNEKLVPSLLKLGALRDNYVAPQTGSKLSVFSLLPPSRVFVFVIPMGQWNAWRFDWLDETGVDVSSKGDVSRWVGIDPIRRRVVGIIIRARLSTGRSVDGEQGGKGECRDK